MHLVLPGRKDRDNVVVSIHVARCDERVRSVEYSWVFVFICIEIAATRYERLTFVHHIDSDTNNFQSVIYPHHLKLLLIY